MTSKRRKWVVLILLGLIAAVTSVAYLTREREPSYAGKPLSYWMELNFGEETIVFNGLPAGHKGADALRHIGSNAVPHLLKWLSYDSSHAPPQSLLKRLVLKMPRSTMPENLRNWANTDYDEECANAAAVAFRILGPDAQYAIPELEELVNDYARSNRSDRATFALASTGKDAIPFLLAYIANSNSPNRRGVVGFFGVFPGLATNAPVLPFLGYLDDTDPMVRASAAFSLGQMATNSQSKASLVIPALTNCLRTNSPKSLRATATVALGKCGDQARVALPILLQEIKDPEVVVRRAATNALLKIAPEVLTNAPPQ